MYVCMYVCMPLPKNSTPLRPFGLLLPMKNSGHALEYVEKTRLEIWHSISPGESIETYLNSWSRGQGSGLGLGLGLLPTDPKLHRCHRLSL